MKRLKKDKSRQERKQRTRRSQRNTHGEERNSTTSRFLALPAEIRNNIYELCLVKKNCVVIKEGLHRPHLLSTCRQIRQEAGSVWYGMNTFTLKVENCNDALLSALTKDANKVHVTPRVIIRPVGQLVWRNLRKWCKNVWAEESLMYAQYDKMPAKAAVVATAHAIVNKYIDHSWARCEHELELWKVNGVLVKGGGGRYRDLWGTNDVYKKH